MKKRRMEKGDLVISGNTGQKSALGTHNVERGQDVGNVVVQRKTANGLVDVVHDRTFRFVFFAFKPDGKVNTTCPPEPAKS